MTNHHTTPSFNVELWQVRTWFVGVSMMELIYFILSIKKMIRWLPRSLTWRVPNPINKIIKLTSKKLRIKNRSDFILWMVINSNRRGRRNITVGNCRWHVWFKKRNMKNWMYPKIWWQSKALCDLPNLCRNRKWTKTLVIKFLTKPCSTKMSSKEPNLITDFKRGWKRAMTISNNFLLFLCSGKMV